jgi:hypothetical protein
MTYARKPAISDVSKKSTEGVVKRRSSHRAGKAKSADAEYRLKQTDHRQLDDTRSEANPNPSSRESQLAQDQVAQDQVARDQSDLTRLKQLPREIGVMLIAAGVVGLVLPGPGTPALIAGGVALWPGAFSKLELWLERRHPDLHQKSMKQIGRFLDDLEKRYPYSRQG